MGAAQLQHRLCACISLEVKDTERGLQTPSNAAATEVALDVFSYGVKDLVRGMNAALYDKAGHGRALHLA